MELLKWGITLLSILAAILAWIAKLKWSKEYRAAKDEIIRSKEAMIAQLNERIQFYKELTPMKLKEYFDSVKSQLEMQIEDLNTQKEKAAKEINDKNNEIIKLEEDKIINKKEIETLRNEKQQLEISAKTLEQQSVELKELNQKIKQEYYFPPTSPGIGYYHNPNKIKVPLEFLSLLIDDPSSLSIYKVDKENKERNIQDNKN